MDELSCDVTVVGGGPAGLAAATIAGEHRRSVVLVDDERTPGGRIWRRDLATVPRRAAEWIARAHSAGVRVLDSASVVDAPSPNRLIAMTQSGPICIRSPRTILATGASERFIPFPGWTLPGVCGVGGLQALAKGGLDLSGARVLIAGTGPLLLAVAAGLRRKGARVLSILEQADARAVRRFGMGLWRHPAKLAQAIGLLATLRGVRREHASWPLRAEGDDRVRRVTIRTATGVRVVDVDWLAVGFGLLPNVELAALLGCRIEDERVVVDEFARTSVDGVFAVGETAGIAGVDAALCDGVTAGLAASGATVAAGRAARARTRERRFAASLARTFALRDELRELPEPDTLVCRCEDVPLSRTLECADLREAKLLARCGMGPCQGRVCGPALRFLRGWDRDRVRPPLFPITFDDLRAIGDPDAREETHT